jgi:hypothetical protein
MKTTPEWAAFVGIAVLVLVAAASQNFAAGIGLTLADRQAWQKLDSTIVSFTFNEQPIEEAVDFLSTLGGVNIILDRHKVEAGKTITLKLNNVPLTTALKLLTEQVSLKWIIRDGVAFISDEEGTRQEPVTVVYDVADFLATPPDFQGPTFELQNMAGANGGRSGSSSGGSSGGGSIFGGANGAGGGGTGSGGGTNTEQSKTREELLADLIDLIRSVIEPGSWDESGATK